MDTAGEFPERVQGLSDKWRAPGTWVQGDFTRFWKRIPPIIT